MPLETEYYESLPSIGIINLNQEIIVGWVITHQRNFRITRFFIVDVPISRIEKITKMTTFRQPRRMPNQYVHPSRARQQGVTLAISLIIMALMMMISIPGMKSSLLQEKKAANSQEQNKALQASESASRYAWSMLTSSYTMDSFIANSGNPGLYDLRSSNTVAGSKLLSSWQTIRSSASWNWLSAASMPATLIAGDSMHLSINPQFAIGMRAPVLRKGSEGYKCIPFDIIGAGKGSTSESSALIELHVIPKGYCDRPKDPIK